MSISMTAVVNIYSVCGGVETSREGKKTRGGGIFLKVNVCAAARCKLGSPACFQQSAAQTTAATGPQILLVCFYTFQFERLKKKSFSPLNPGL